MARVIQVIEVDQTIGRGTDENPFRILRYYWSFDGDLLATSVDSFWIGKQEQERQELLARIAMLNAKEGSGGLR